MRVVRSLGLVVVKLNHRSERSQRFTFDSCEVKQRSQRSQRFHFNSSENKTVL